MTIGPNILRTSSNPGQVMTFRHLPSGARVRIYTIRGELLFDASDDGTGNAAWNGKNAAGRQVASGVYVALDAPFVDVLVKFDLLGGGGGWELDDTGLRAVGGHGDEVKLGDRMMVEITDVAMLRRTVYAKRLGGPSPERSKRKQGPPGKGSKKDVRQRVRKIDSRTKGGGGKRRR